MSPPPLPSQPKEDATPKAHSQSKTNTQDTVTSAAPQSSAQEQPWSVELALSKIPPLYSSQTTSFPLSFLHLLERLKTTKREGWRLKGIMSGESISDHMYRMSIITMLAPANLVSRLNVPHCTKMALVHDMAELLVGDITPKDGVLKEEKARREAETMKFLCCDKLGGGEQAGDIKAVFEEYEKGETLESVFVHDVDKVELLLQMMEYEKSWGGKNDLGELALVAKKVQLEEMKKWCREILKERVEFWTGLGKSAENLDLTI